MINYLSIIICTLAATFFAVCGWRIGGAAIRNSSNGGCWSFLLAVAIWFIAMCIFIVDICIIIRKVYK